ncbi:MAG TPA: sigma 54-interacting transcriptional regulator [Kofleriaceae bacterium]|nr:sigma 54-interacting transcriptional regulator [Kofleriaceae bacterium]
MSKLDATVTTREDVLAPHAEQLFLLVVGDGVYATEALPGSGTAVIGRAPDCDVVIEEGSISRNHAVLSLGEPLTITDSSSANGTWVRDERIPPNVAVEIRLNEAVRVGTVTIIVQRRSQKLRTRRMRTHDYFENRLEDECARASRHDATFVVVHLVLDDPRTDVRDQLSSALREGDVVAQYAPGELEIMLLDAAPDQVSRVIRRLETALETRGVAARIGSAWYPRDGRDPSTLAARARTRAHGSVAEEHPESHGDIVIADERMTALHDLVSRVAAADISVLLTGETGVGKEVIAEQIHRQSARHDKPFLRLNCAALTETLLESELFGHERGAFTGATASKPGLLEVAEGGVIFLDEVGELHASTQAKLLRVLDERKLLRVGGLTPRPIDVRIISATNRDLDAEVERGAFRLDLLYRLNAMSIIIPPLRERPGEIEPLARKFLHQIAAKLDRGVPELSAEALQLMRSYSWPGNVRELRNVVERAMVLATGNVIEVHDLPHEKMRATFAATAQRESSTIPIPDAPRAADPEVDERQRVIDALEACAGNQTHAAKLLGISRRTLINKIEKFAVPRPRKR